MPAGLGHTQGGGDFIIQESNTRFVGRGGSTPALPVSSHAKHSVLKTSGQERPRGRIPGTAATRSRGGHSRPRGTSGGTEPPLTSWWVGNGVEKTSPQGTPTRILATALCAFIHWTLCLLSNPSSSSIVPGNTEKARGAQWKEEEGTGTGLAGDLPTPDSLPKHLCLPC